MAIEVRNKDIQIITILVNNDWMVLKFNRFPEKFNK